MPPKPDPKALRKLRDDRVLAEMTKRVFSAGFAWSVIENKWPGFEEAFIGFEPSRLTFEPDEFWHKLTMNARIVRNGAKIMSVRENGRFVLEVAKTHGSFGKFLARWPPSPPAIYRSSAPCRSARIIRATGMGATSSAAGRSKGLGRRRPASTRILDYARHAELRITLQKLPRWKCGSLSAIPSALTLPNVVAG